MQTVQKKPRSGGLQRRMLLLLLAVLLLTLAVTASMLLSRPTPEEDYDAPPDFPIQLVETAYSDVVSITIRRGDEAPWTAVYSGSDDLGDEFVTILGDDGFTLTWAESISFLLGAVCVTAEEVLTDDPAEYRDHLADFGLNPPELEAHIVYASSPELHLRVGNKGPDGTWRYMLVGGDDRLFAFSNGSVEALFVNRDTLRKVSQPPLHKARIDCITLTEGESVTQWTLDGAITDADAIDKWRITAPFAYPAAADAMEKLLSSAAGLRLSAYVAPATAENLTLYGFDTPRLTIELHQAAGTIAATNADGAAEATDYAESTTTYVIGGEKSDMIDYVRCGDGIYLSSHFATGVFMGYDVAATMSRFPLLTALGNLAKLTIAQEDAVSEYVLTRTERVAENNELVTDEEGHPVYDVTVACNGEPVDYAAFEAAYSDLALVMVSGKLSADETVSAAPHTAYTFTDVDGTIHTVELATFDVLHDAVIVDGYPAFYLIKGGFNLTLD